MNILEIIAKKRDYKELSKEEIAYFIEEYTKEEITDYQASALVMAMYMAGMTEKETADLTWNMAYSGDILDLSSLGTVVDKHSTGGVGDKITFILMPLVASLGVKVAKMSGRGLGFTGGTADKLEAIPGYQINLNLEEFISNVEKIGISLMTQTLNLAPADKKLYALRDTISCTNSIPLIASSIMSKKIAAGANKIVLDVTCGSGAFMKTQEEAVTLANMMKKIGELVGKETVCIITNMDEPLGYTVGNTIEVIEAVEALKGNIPKDVEEVVLELGSYMLKLAEKGNDIEENKKVLKQQLQNGKAYEKFIELVENQGGDISYIKRTEKFPKARYEVEVVAKEEGVITKLNAEEIGKVAGYLGAGRMKKEDNIDFTAGIKIYKKVGEEVKKGTKLATILTNKEEKIEEAQKDILQAYEIEKEEQKVHKKKTILQII